MSKYPAKHWATHGRRVFIIKSHLARRFTICMQHVQIDFHSYTNHTKRLTSFVMPADVESAFFWNHLDAVYFYRPKAHFWGQFICQLIAIRRMQSQPLQYRPELKYLLSHHSDFIDYICFVISSSGLLTALRFKCIVFAKPTHHFHQLIGRQFTRFSTIS